MILNYLLQYVFLVMPLAAHLAHDAPQIRRNSIPEHKKNAYLLLVITTVLGLQLSIWARPHIHFWQYALYAGAIHFAFFNYILNLLRVPPKPLTYLGNGFFDFALKLLTPWPALLAQLILLFAGFSVYHHINWFKE